MKNLFCLFTIFFTATLVLNGQIKEIKGLVIDAKTKEALPYASVSVHSELIGTNTDMLGRFNLQLPEKLLNDSATISYIGYNSATLALNRINDKTIELIPIVYSLNEISITPHKKQTLILNPFKTRDIDQLTNSGYYPIIHALYFPYKADYNSKFLKEVRICINTANVKTQFGIRLYNANPDGTPGSDLLKKPIIITSKNVFYHFINHIVKINIEDLNIEFPESGIFVGMEQLIIPVNAYPMPGARIKNDLLYDPNLQYIKVDSTKQRLAWNCYNNSWKLAVHYHWGAPQKKIYQIPAISLVLND